MFVSLNQGWVFLSAFAIGGTFGAVYSLFALIKRFIKYKVICGIMDFLFCILLSVFYVYVSFKLSFPNVRLYMPVGTLLGFLCYTKSFHIILAKIFNVFYNRIRERREYDRRRKSKLRSGGKIYPGRGISTDIIGSGVAAYVNALNKILHEEENQ